MFMDNIGKREIMIIAIVASVVLACVSAAVTRSAVDMEVKSKQNEIESLKTQIENVTGLLDNATSSIIDMFFNLDEKANIISNLNDEIISKTEEITVLTDELGLVNIELLITQQWLAENLSYIEDLENGTCPECPGCEPEPYNVTQADIEAFLLDDTTDSEIYDSQNFTCIDFSAMLNNNSVANDIETCFIHLYFYNGSRHALVGFNTTDAGIVYVEPQSDEWVVNLTVGNDYWTDCVVGNHTSPLYNDTIRRIITVW